MNASVNTTPLSVSISQTTGDGLRESLQQHPGSLFAILDACDEPRVPAMVKILGDQAVSLYRGRADEEHWAIAPYLVQVESKLLEWILDELTGTPWGIFISSATNLESLRKHFRRFLMVKGPDGNELYFRYYDPRVLPTFLKSSNAEETKKFFGPVNTYMTPVDADDFLEISCNT